jgi:hypothetical protein
MVVQFIKFKSALSIDEVMRIAHERIDRFRAIPGLIQKYYFVEESTGEIGGIYLWDSMESLQAYRESDLAKTIAAAYKVEWQPRIEVLKVIETLRDTDVTARS